MKKTRQKNFRIIPPPDRLFTLRKCPFCGKKPITLEIQQMTETVIGYKIECSDLTHCAKVVSIYQEDTIRAWGTE